MSSGDDSGFKERCRYCPLWFTDKKELDKHEAEESKKRGR
jgi:hypothetical protein